MIMTSFVQNNLFQLSAHTLLIDIATVSITKHAGLDSDLKEKYTNKIWHFVKNMTHFLANLVTAAPSES